MSKTFKFAGVSRRNGSFKARFANDQMRVKVLAKTGSSDIDMIELRHPMSKEEAIKFLLSIDFDNGNAEIRAALEEGLAKRQPKVKSEAKVEVKPTMETIKAKVTAKKAAPKSTVTKVEAQATQEANFEDAPF
jgi:hypothetical protein